MAIFIVLTVYLQATAPFKNYFQAICIWGFVRTGIASPIGDAIYRSGITGLMNKHLTEIGNHVNISLQSSMSNMEFIGTEAMVSTLRELYGYTFIFGIVILVLIAVSRFKRNLISLVPSLKSLYISSSESVELENNKNV